MQTPPGTQLITLPLAVRARRPDGAVWRYLLALVYRFRYTLLALGSAVAFASVVYRLAPPPTPAAERPSMVLAIYGGWMTLLAQPLYTSPHTWYLALMAGLYPLLGFVMIGEGIVRLALLVISKQQGEKEWMKVMASTQRDHVVLCGLGHLGYRVLEQLVAAKIDVVVLEKHRDSRHMVHAREMGVAVLIRDMKEDQALVDAGIEHARAVIICTNDDMANLEVALDSRRLNPGIRIVMRLFDQQIAGKIAGAMSIDAAFSSSALAAPMVAALSVGTKVLSSYVIAGVAHVAAEMTIDAGSPLEGKTVGEIEVAYAARVLARQAPDAALDSPPTQAAVVTAGDVIVVHTTAAQLATLAAAREAAVR
jgi:voltage-gated potassium channel